MDPSPSPLSKRNVPRWAWVSLLAGSVALTAFWLLIRSSKQDKKKKPTAAIKHKKTKTLQVVQSPRYKLVEQFAEAYGLTTDELQVKLKSYLDGGKSPSIDRREFNEIMTKLGINDDNLAETTFRAWDLNRDGKIDFSELMFNMVKFAKGSVEDKLRFMFHTHDLDGDGFLTPEELFRIYKSLFRSEGLATDEIELEDKVNKLVIEILKKGDRNHDSAISEEEFIHLTGLQEFESNTFTHLAQEMLAKFGVVIEGTTKEKVHN